MSNYQYGDDDNGGRGYSNTCYSYQNQCKELASSCDNDDDSSGTNYLNYLNYIGCQKKANQDNNNYFWVSPHCDSSSGDISMGVFYDQYCDQYAGDDVDVSDFLGDDFDTDVFTSVQSDVQCLNCGKSVSVNSQ